MRICAYKTVESVEIYGCDIDETLVNQINEELQKVWVKEANTIDCPVYTIEDIEDVWRAHSEFTAMSSTFTNVKVTLYEHLYTDQTYKTSMYDYLLEYLLDAIDDNYIGTRWTETTNIEYDYDERIRFDYGKTC